MNLYAVQNIPYLNLRIGTKLEVPKAREQVVHFLEVLARHYPNLTKLRTGDKMVNLEEPREGGGYRWVNLESKLISAGHVCPTDYSVACDLHKVVLRQMPYDLGISRLEIDFIEVLVGFDLECRANHDEVIASCLLGDSPILSILDEEDSVALDVQPVFVFGLDEKLDLQARVNIVTRTQAYQVRTATYDDDDLSIHFVVRKLWNDDQGEDFDDLLQKTYDEIIDAVVRLSTKHVIPKILIPLAGAIASKQ